MNTHEYNQRVFLRMKNIKELRNMARNIGVVSPTSKSKEKLIEEMIDILEGRVIPEYVNSNRGRPAKNIVFEKGNVEYNTSSRDFEFKYMVASPSVKYNIDMVDNVLLGIVSKEEDGFYLRRLKFIKSVADFKIQEDFVKKYALKDGDLVEYIKNDSEIIMLKVNNAEKLADVTDIDIKNVTKNAKNVFVTKNKAEILYILEVLSKNDKILIFTHQNIPFSGKNVLIINNFEQNKGETTNLIGSLTFAESLLNTQNFGYVIIDDIDLAVLDMQKLKKNLLDEYIREINLTADKIVKRKSKLIFIAKESNAKIDKILSKIK